VRLDIQLANLTVTVRSVIQWAFCNKFRVRSEVWVTVLQYGLK
jgi:hypothetical protein